MKNNLLCAAVLAFSISGNATPKIEPIEPEMRKKAIANFSACGNFLKYDEDAVYTGFGHYWTGPEVPRRPWPGILRFVLLGEDSEYQVETLDSAIDVLTAKGSTWVLTPSHIEEWNLKNFTRLAVYPTTNITGPLGTEAHATGFALHKEKIVVSHGRLGLTIFDLNSKKITKQISLLQKQNPLESTVNGLSVSGKYAFLAIDSFSLVNRGDKVPFQGIIIVDLETESVAAEYGGMDPGADSIASDNNVAILSYYGMPLFKFTISSLLTGQNLRPSQKVWKFPLDGHPTGKASMDQKYYYTCFSVMPKEESEGIYFRKIPMALDRRSLILN